ncbi:MAG: amino acid carrier protein [Oscillospiraceae bacterium]|nr:amino acid carrier protein [Oscillospiraceae bacterium]
MLSFLEFLKHLNRLLWGNVLTMFLLGMGAFCLFYGKAASLQSFRLLKSNLKNNKNTNSNKTSKKLSPFQSCMTSLAAAMGTGNIVGVATAITLGGAGAIFWMWIAAFLGMGLIYAENVLGCRYRDQKYTGAVAYIRNGLHQPWLAGIFAVCCVAASFGMGNMTQSHAMAESLHESFAVPPILTGIVTAILLGLIIFGGTNRIGNVTSILIPVLSGMYLLFSLLVILKYHEHLGTAFRDIFRSAFGWQSIGGGISGEVVRRTVSVGIRRGVFSNEAGLGSSGLLHGDADSNHPEFLGLCGMLEVILDTFVCCTATALVILCTDAPTSGTDGAVLVLTAFRSGLGNIADWILPPMIALFAFCTLIGWSYCGVNAFRTLTENSHVIRLYQGLFCLAAGLGAVLQPEFVWTLADIANACMAYCNLPAILLLYPGWMKHCKK